MLKAAVHRPKGGNTLHLMFDLDEFSPGKTIIVTFGLEIR